ncbi:MAG TPA: ChbG/HpnK family deacetylase [Phycisphaerae bacterium]|nr:ChbG/HpnK family deacetylase [Phycisphaerae bacterium]
MTTVLDNPPSAQGPARERPRSAASDADGAAVLIGAGRRTVILHADDLGLVYAFNEGIRRAHKQGCLTSTCLRANGYAYEHAIHEVLPACPKLGVGVHLCLNEADCVAPRDEVPLLLGSDGRQRTGYGWLIKLAGTEAGLIQIERELRAQIEKVLGDGVRPDHLNSHQHVHMIPAVFRITCRLAAEYGIECVRLAREPAYRAGPWRKRIEPLISTNYVKHVLLNHYARANATAAGEFKLATPDHFVGVNYTGRMDVGTITAGLEAAGRGAVEILLHPTVAPDSRDTEYPAAYLREYVATPARARELAALTSTELRDFLHQEGWTPASFGGWMQARRRNRPEVNTPYINVEVRRLCEATVVVSPPWVSAAHRDARVFAQLVISQVQPGQRVLDVGTGSGILAICVAKAGHQVEAADVSNAAVCNAVTNAAGNGVGFECYRSDLLESVEGRFDLIAFNPPYNFRPDNFASNVAKNLLRRIPWVRQNSGGSMPRSVLRFHLGLIGRLIAQAPEHLSAGGTLMLHVFESEVEALSGILPAGARVALLRHPDLSANRTVGMVIRNLAINNR